MGFEQLPGARGGVGLNGLFELIDEIIVLDLELVEVRAVGRRCWHYEHSWR